MILQIYAIQALVSLDAFDTFPGLYVRVFLSCIQALELSEGVLSKVAIDSLNRSLPKKNLFSLKELYDKTMEYMRKCTPL